jgi:hypothetical protein
MHHGTNRAGQAKLAPNSQPSGQAKAVRETLYAFQKKSNRAKLILTAFLPVAFLIGVVAAFDKSLFPNIHTMTELREGSWPIYPASSSDYLPFTTPRATTVEGPNFGKIEFNELGYRGPDPRTIGKPPHYRRILLLGDSFTLGWGLAEEDTFASRIRKAYAGSAPAVEVINAGYHDGYSPDAYYAYLLREGLALAPDLIVEIIFTGNDIYPDVSQNIWNAIDALGAPTQVRTIRLYSDYQGKLLNLDMLPWNFHVPWLSNWRLFLAASLWTRRGFGPPNAEGLLGKELSKAEAWERFSRSVRATSLVAEAKNIPIVFASLPFVGRQPHEDPYYEPIQKLIMSDLKRPYVSLHKHLNSSHQIPGDAHLNAEGSRVVTEALLQVIDHYLPR